MIHPDAAAPSPRHRLEPSVTHIDTDAIRKLANAATPGPWMPTNEIKQDERTVVCVHAEGHGDETDDAAVAEIPFQIGDDLDDVHADAAFIAAARDLVPAMADEIERLREQLFAQKPVIEAAQAWAEACETDPNDFPAEDALKAEDVLHDAIEQYRLMDMALTNARAEATR